MANLGTPRDEFWKEHMKKEKTQVTWLQPLDCTGKSNYGKSWPSKGKNGSDHIREILIPRKENLIMEQNVDRQPPV